MLRSRHLSLLSNDLEKLLEVAKRGLEEITSKVDLGENRIELLREFMARSHLNRLVVLNKQDELERFSGSVLPDSIRIEVAHIEYTTSGVIARMEGTITDTLTQPDLYSKRG